MHKLSNYPFSQLTPSLIWRLTYHSNTFFHLFADIDVRLRWLSKSFAPLWRWETSWFAVLDGPGCSIHDQNSLHHWHTKWGTGVFILQWSLNCDNSDFIDLLEPILCFMISIGISLAYIKEMHILYELLVVLQMYEATASQLTDLSLLNRARHFDASISLNCVKLSSNYGSTLW